jgi:hypothetical protein
VLTAMPFFIDFFYAASEIVPFMYLLINCSNPLALCTARTCIIMVTGLKFIVFNMTYGNYLLLIFVTGMRYIVLLSRHANYLLLRLTLS